MTHLKNGSNRAVLIQDRDRQLLAEIASLRVIDREQAKLIAGFGSTTRANARLLALTRAGLLTRAFVGTAAGGRKALYSVSSKGGALLGRPVRSLGRPSDALLIADPFIEHQLAVNSVVLAFRYRPIPAAGVRFRHYRLFTSPLSAKALIVPDGYIELDTPQGVRCMFLEVDRGTESSKVWNRKIDGYLNWALSGEFAASFRQPQFRVLTIALSDRRVNSLLRTIEKRTDKIFWFTTLSAINREGLWNGIWLRPKDEQRHSLI